MVALVSTGSYLPQLTRSRLPKRWRRQRGWGIFPQRPFSRKRDIQVYREQRLQERGGSPVR